MKSIYEQLKKGIVNECQDLYIDGEITDKFFYKAIEIHFMDMINLTKYCVVAFSVIKIL